MNYEGILDNSEPDCYLSPVWKDCELLKKLTNYYPEDKLDVYPTKLGID
ncbi:hypothetical protein [Coleofasciculus sp.]